MNFNLKNDCEKDNEENRMALKESEQQVDMLNSNVLMILVKMNNMKQVIQMIHEHLAKN